MKSNAQEYIAGCPADRADTVQKLYDLMKQSIPAGYEEGMNFGMITWEVPLSVFPDTYNKKPMQFAALANQKNYISLYLMSPLVIPELKSILDNSGKTLKMGKSCINFKSLDELPLDALKEVLQKSEMQTFIEGIKKGLQKRASAVSTKTKKASSKKSTTAKPAKKAAAKPAKKAAKKASAKVKSAKKPATKKTAASLKKTSTKKSVKKPAKKPAVKKSAKKR
jgi:hypothetical protein